jgi:nitrogen fixation/metabolism regulation signal transduction histidine kinase
MAVSQRFISVSVKFAALLSLLPLVAILVLTYISTSALTQAYQENMQRLGNTITQNVAVLIENAVKGGDYAFQGKALQDTVSAMAEIEDGLILKGPTLESSASQRQPGKIPEDRLQKASSAQARDTVVAISYSRGSQHYIDFVKDIYNGDEKYRTLVFGFSLQRLDEKIRRAWINALILTASFFVFGTLTAILLARSITRPLKELVQEAATISSGNLDHQIHVRSSDEIGLLAHAFERMRLSLKSRITEIAKKALSLEGTLKVFALPDLLQFVCTAGRTGRLVIDNEGRQANIYFQNGEIIHCTIGNLTGKDAVFRIFNWTSGDFRFEPGRFDIDQTITLPWQYVVMEGARQTDEMGRVRQLIPSSEMVLEMGPPPEGMDQIRLTPEELQISSIAGEGRRVAEILEASPLEEIDTYKVLYRLVSIGLLRPGKNGS